MYCVWLVNSADSRMSCALERLLALPAVSNSKLTGRLHLPYAPAVHEQSIGPFNEQAYIYRPPVKYDRRTIIEKPTLGFDLSLDWLLRLHNLYGAFSLLLLE